jgi:hypothetical protein
MVYTFRKAIPMKFDAQKCAILCLLKEGMQTQLCSEDLNEEQLILQKECISNNMEYSQIHMDLRN